MAKFLKVILSNPQGAQLLNLEIYLTACSHEDFVQMLTSRGLLLLE